eukprot:TRINITY_DN45463_c0_g1_i1.p1 TRINITY_DN45463_c0_g1~~TRINITY_DN45463_c0_g1_i1.p1  ORF type:complete len:544 (+),score=104.34 TRINITY_DN45463_c0_g1_i1:74-1705(+)
MEHSPEDASAAAARSAKRPEPRTSAKSRAKGSAAASAANSIVASVGGNDPSLTDGDVSGALPSDAETPVVRSGVRTEDIVSSGDEITVMAPVAVVSEDIRSADAATMPAVSAGTATVVVANVPVSTEITAKTNVTDSFPAAAIVDTLPPVHKLLTMPSVEATACVLSWIWESRADGSDHGLVAEIGGEAGKSPLVDLADAMRSAPAEDIRALGCHVIAGLAGLSDDDRVVATRIALRLGSSLVDPNRPVTEEDRRLSDKLMLFENRAQLMQRPHAELQELRTAVATEATGLLAKPKELLGVLGNLELSERWQLQDVLIHTQTVPIEQRLLLEATVRPGGLADGLSEAVSVGESAFEYVWIVAALPVGEAVLSFMVYGLYCTVSLNFWLLIDSFLSLGVAGAAVAAAMRLQPVMHVLREDPVGAATRWLGSDSTLPLEEKLEAAAPDVLGPTEYLQGLRAMQLSVLLLAFGFVWLVVGAFLVLETIFWGCHALLFVLTLMVVAVRGAVVLGCVRVGLFVWTELHKENHASGSIHGYGTLRGTGA